MRLAGNGALLIYERDEVGYKEFRRCVGNFNLVLKIIILARIIVSRYPWKDGLHVLDVTWSELNEAILVVASGDGCVVIYDQANPHVGLNH